MKLPASRPPSLIFQGKVQTSEFGRLHIRLYLAALTGEGVFCVCIPGARAPAVSPATATSIAEEVRRRILAHTGGRAVALHLFLPYSPDSSGRERWAKAVFVIPGRRREPLGPPSWSIVGRSWVAPMLDR
ncbi:MAG TPA: hypothetical protein VFT74_06190 [Isosphaeraceae bacterium]|nr:hypothetical protein [Isosphaeraceae bacterium]